MKKVALLALVVLTCSAAWADIPSLQLDGTYSKASPHADPYPYTALDFEHARANPLGLVVGRTLSRTGPAYAPLGEKLKQFPYAEMDARMRKQYVQVVEREFELTDKEKEVVTGHPFEFPEESRRGKRVARSEVLKLGDKEYSFVGCQFRGAADLDGDGSKELVVQWFDGATHAGARAQVRVFSQQGEFLWYREFEGPGGGGGGTLIDVEGNGRHSLVLSSDNVEIMAFSAAARGVPLDPGSDSLVGPRPAVAPPLQPAPVTGSPDVAPETTPKPPLGLSPGPGAR